MLMRALAGGKSGKGISKKKGRDSSISMLPFLLAQQTAAKKKDSDSELASLRMEVRQLRDALNRK